MTMMKRILRPAAALAAAAALATGAYAAELVPVGETVGIEVRTEGMLVAGLTGVETGSGEVCPAADSGIQPGDVLVLRGIRSALVEGRTDEIPATLLSGGAARTLTLSLPGLTADERDILLCGCLINYYAN